MSGTAEVRRYEPPSLQGSARVLMLSTVVMAAAAAAVLALGTQDAHLLRLGVVAALWAALFAAFTTARARREISSRAEHADQLRAAYQLELQREVVARREHALTVETDNCVVAAWWQRYPGLLCSTLSIDNQLKRGVRIVLPGGKVECPAIRSHVATVHARDMEHTVPYQLP